LRGGGRTSFKLTVKNLGLLKELRAFLKTNVFWAFCGTHGNDERNVNVTECEESCGAHVILKDGFLGCSESHISDDNAILNKLKSTQSEDCLIMKLFRMTRDGKKMSTKLANDKAQLNVKDLFTYSLINLFTPKNTTYRPNVLTTSNNLSHHSPFTTHHSRKRCAFTLAEVLITLAIIGVVAALTLPALTAKYQEKVLLSQGKKAYSVISNALLKYSTDLGTPGEYWAIFDGANSNLDLAKNLSKYFKTMRICTYGEIQSGSCGVPGLQATSYASTVLVLADGMTLDVRNDNTSSGTCFYYWQKPILDAAGNPTGKFEQHTSSRCGRIYFDVNGVKNPNQYGKDVFEVEIFEKKIVAGDSLRRGIKGFDEVISNDKID